MRFENDVISVELDANTGGFASIYDKRCSHEYILTRERALLFRAMAPNGDRAFEHVDGAAPEVSVDGATATLAYKSDGIEATATLTLDGPAILATLRLTNTGPAPIEETLFPWLRGLGPMPDVRIVWPSFWGRKIENFYAPKDAPLSTAALGGDHHTWNEWTQKAVARYPSHLTTAWCDYGNDGHGIALEGRHTDFSIMDFFVHKIVEKTHDPVRRSVDLVTSHPRRVKPGETWESPPVRILVHQGDWHIVADEHREWLDTWIRKPDRPRKFAEAIGWHFFFMKHQDGLELNTYEDLPKMSEASLAAGCPYLLVFGWQTGGHDNNYLYRYVPNGDWGGEDALRENLKKCRDMGVEVMPFYNGTLANVELSEHKEFGYKWEAKTRTGHPYYAGDWARNNYDAPTRNRAMLHYEIAPCDEHQKYFLETVKRIVQDYGFGNTQLDQISEKMLVDYNEDHIKTTPDRVYVDGLAAILPAVRELVRAANPEGVMISEVLNDFTGQWCDSSWDWNVLLPFPEPVLYSLPWLMGSHEIDALEYDEVNKAFAYKLHLDMKIDGGDAPITKYPKFAEHVRANAELRKRVADYYVYGDFRDQEGIEFDGPDTVIAKVFHNKDSNKIGIVVAETGGKAGAITLGSEWQPASGIICADSNTGAAEELDANEQLKVTLKPYEVRVLCIDLAE